MLILKRIKTLNRPILIQITTDTSQLRTPKTLRPDMFISKLIRPATDSSSKLIRLDTAKLLKPDMANRPRLTMVSRLRLDTDSNKKPIRLVTDKPLRLATAKRKLDMARLFKKLPKPLDMFSLHLSQHHSLYRINISRQPMASLLLR